MNIISIQNAFIHAHYVYAPVSLTLQESPYIATRTADYVEITCNTWPQWCSQNFEKVTHIEGRLLYQAMIFYNYVPFRDGNFS